MPSGATVGSLGAGALGVAGGAFAAYQGLQRGGVGGYTQAAGGAATAGLSAAAMAGAAIPVYGWVAAAAALIIGALLPGQKPSDRTGVYRVNTVTGAESADGLNGDRFSQENRDSAKGIADSVKTLGEQIGSLAGLPGAVANNFEVMVGGRDGVKYMANGKTEKFGTDDDAAQKLAEFATRDLLEKAARQTTDSNVRQVIGAKGTADPTATLEALEWYQSVYKAMAAPIEEAARATSTFETSIKALKDPYEAAITKARELGLAVEPLITRMDSDIAKAYAARDAKVDETKQSWADRLYTANGGPETIDRTLEAFDRAATAERVLDRGRAARPRRLRRSAYRAARHPERHPDRRAHGGRQRVERCGHAGKRRVPRSYLRRHERHLDGRRRPRGVRPPGDQGTGRVRQARPRRYQPARAGAGRGAGADRQAVHRSGERQDARLRWHRPQLSRQPERDAGRQPVG
jgi:hypothetical protein